MAALCGRSLARATLTASRNGLKRSICTSRIAMVKDQETHTGQAWEDDDIRSLRFMDKTKETNENWAINLIANIPPIVVNTRVVACHGGSNPALGHPKVYINLDTHEPVTCIYCGLRYMYKKEPEEKAAQN